MNKDILSYLMEMYAKEVAHMSDVFRMLDVNNKDELQEFIKKAKDNLEMLQGVIYSIEYELYLNEGVE